MAESKKILALKPFEEAVRRHCEKLSHKELCDFICNRAAQEISAHERADFLKKLTSGSKKEIRGNSRNDLISKIKSLKKAIKKHQESIEDGTFFEDYEDDYGYDEDPPPISEEQKEEMETLFAEADHLFLSDELKLAAEAYQLLLGIFRYDEDAAFDYDIESHLNLNWREIRARYARCVYETAPSHKRVEQMLDAMEIDARQFQRNFVSSEGDYPLLKDVLDARSGELSEWKSFLNNWKNDLKNETGERAAVLFFEAVHGLDGIDGLAVEVRKNHVPVGYGYWLDKLVSDQNWNDAAAIAQESLENIPHGTFRAQAAEILSAAAQNMGDNSLILKGKREGFYSMPDENSLSVLVEEAARQNVKTEELEKALKAKIAKKYSGELNVKILLMLGRLDDALKIVDTTKPLGWGADDSGIGVFFGGLLAALTGSDPKGKTIQILLNRYTGKRRGYFFDSAENPNKIIFEEILAGVRGVFSDESKKQKWFEFVKKIGGNRIDAIVSNKHRGAYNRAAEVLGALTECFLINQQTNQAKDLLDLYRNQKYSRHSAFRSEVDNVLQNSAILKPLYSKTKK